jgi:hypothetical protein
VYDGATKQLTPALLRELYGSQSDELLRPAGNVLDVQAPHDGARRPSTPGFGELQAA